MSETKPCPFCGGTNIGERHVRAYSVDSSYDVFGCYDCDAFVPYWSAEEWNRRAPASEGGEPVAWQWRYKTPDMTEWSEWFSGYDLPGTTMIGEQLQRRPLYAGEPTLATPPSPPRRPRRGEG